MMTSLIEMLPTPPGVVGDGAEALSVDNGAAVGRAQQINEERLVGSIAVSPLMVTEMVLVRSPAAKLTVPVGCAT